MHEVHGEGEMVEEYHPDPSWKQFGGKMAVAYAGGEFGKAIDPRLGPLTAMAGYVLADSLSRTYYSRESVQELVPDRVEPYLEHFNME